MKKTTRRRAFRLARLPILWAKLVLFWYGLWRVLSGCVIIFLVKYIGHSEPKVNGLCQIKVFVCHWMLPPGSEYHRRLAKERVVLMVDCGVVGGIASRRQQQRTVAPHHTGKEREQERKLYDGVVVVKAAKTQYWFSWPTTPPSTARSSNSRSRNVTVRPCWLLLVMSYTVHGSFM